MGNDDNESMEFYDQGRIMSNAQAVDWVRTLMGVVSGCATGILGITAFNGFFAFIGFYAITSMALLVKMKCDPSQYIPGQKPWTFVFDNIMSQLMGHLLFWTMFYGIVHVY
jgi:ER membrane protein complex subunit 6